ncbi:MAG TPA: response regulator [Holophagaceae bacterium]
MRILLAEDNPNLKVQVLLEMAGHTVVRAATAAQALIFHSEAPFPVVVADLSIPGLNGYELSRMIRSRTKVEYVYIILLVEPGQEFRFEEAQAAEVDDVLPLPVEPDLLRARLRVAKRMLDLYDELNQLKGLIPICSYCKRIRQDQGFWQQIEAYLAGHSHATFSHGICPECAAREFGETLRARRTIGS